MRGYVQSTLACSAKHAWDKVQRSRCFGKWLGRSYALRPSAQTTFPTAGMPAQPSLCPRTCSGLFRWEYELFTLNQSMTRECAFKRGSMIR